MESVSTKLPQIRKYSPESADSSCSSYEFDRYARSQTQIGKLGQYVIDTPRDEDLERREQLWNYQQNHRGALTKVRANGEVQTFRFTQPEQQDGDTERNKSDRKTSSAPKHVVARLRLRTTKADAKSSSALFSPDMEVPDRLKSSPANLNTSRLDNRSKATNKKDKDTNDVTSGSHLDNFAKQNGSYPVETLPDLTSALTKLGYLRFTRNVVHHGGGFFGRHGDLSRSWTTLSNSEPSKVPSNILPQVLESKGYGSYRNIENIRRSPNENHVTHKLSSPKDLHSCLKRTALNTEKTKLKMLLQNELTKKMTDRRRRPFINDVEIPKFSKSRNDFNNNESELKHEPLSVKGGEVVKPKQLISDIVKPLCQSPPKSVSPPNKPNTGIDLGKSTSHSVIKTNVKAVQSDNKKTEKVKQPGPDMHMERERSDLSIDMPMDRFGPSTHSAKSGQSLNGSNSYHWNKKSYITENDKLWIKKTIEDSNIIDNSNYGGFARTKPVQLPKIVDPKRSN